MNEELENRNCPCEMQKQSNRSCQKANNSGCPCEMTKDANCACKNMNRGNCSCNMNMIENYVESVNDKCKDDTRRELINKIKCYQFAVVELALYLDTHPEDEKALCLHKKYCKELKELQDKYQKVYGPLTINYPCNKWRWIEEPWPWERGNF